MKNRTNHKLNNKFIQTHEIRQKVRRIQIKTNPHSYPQQGNKPYLRANGSILPLALRPGLAILLILLSITGTFVINNLTQNNSASAASITLSIPNTLSLDINGASPSGTFAKSSPATVSTKTDSTTGYTLSIKSKDSVDSNCLKLDSNSGSSKINSISSGMSEEEFKSSAPMNTWGYRPDKFNGMTNSNFLPGPTSVESIIDKTKTANNVLGNNYGIVLAAKVNTDLPAGIYKNIYTLTATANAVTYSVHYNNLESSTGGPSPNPQTGQTDGNSFKLINNTPTKEGYEFKGYCMLQPKEDGSCETAILQPGNTFVIYCDENNIELWAMWGPIMQNFNCSTLSVVGQTKQIKDSRDGTMYNVAKLADNKCWMTDNLRIADKNLTSADSDISSSYSLPASSTNGNAYVDNIYGGYYAWIAATAGTGNSATTDGVQAAGSICPKGWRLPSKQDFIDLDKALGGIGENRQNNSSLVSKYTSSPNNFKMGGFYNSGSPTNVGDEADYWSSTVGFYNNVYNLGFTSSQVNPQSSNNRNLGFPIRCISRQ